MEIRVAEHDDADEIARVHVASWRAAYRGQIPDEVLDGLDVTERQRMWREVLRLEHVDVWVVGRPVVGFLSLAAPSAASPPGSPRAELSALYLLPDAWRRGIGRRLVEAARARAIERRCGSITLWVLRENVIARRFYEAVGFTVDGRERVDTALVAAPLRELGYAMHLTD